MACSVDNFSHEHLLLAGMIMGHYLILGWQVCSIATNIFGSWVRDSPWLNYVVTNHLNSTIMELTGYALDGDHPEDIGYVQVWSDC